MGDQFCGHITEEMIRDFLLERRKVSAYTANRELRYLRATFNFGKKRKLILVNPTDGIEFLPVERKLRYIPPISDVEMVSSAADSGVRHYLITISDTMGRVSEINRLKWDDVDLENGYLILYTRKNRGGHLTPRKVLLTVRLSEILKPRFRGRKKSNPWVFYASYQDWKTKKKVVALLSIIDKPF